MSTEKPIIFNSAMVRAILDGKKTQTRRPASITKLEIESCPKYARDGGEFHSLFVSFPKPTKGSLSTGTATSWTAEQANGWIAAKFGPFGAPGDLLWVREAFQSFGDSSSITPPVPHSCQVRYDADGTTQWLPVPAASLGVFSASTKKRPSIHMPRWASRITLRVKRVWVERVDSISESDATAEGLGDDSELWHLSFDAQGRFQSLWDSIYSDRFPWSSNPWVWCCEFEVVK